MQTGKTSWKTLVVGIAFASLSASACAVDSMSVEVGTASKLRVVRVAAQWDWDARWFESNGNHIGGHWDLSLAQWRGTRYRNIPDARQDITTIGFTPVFRWQQDNKKGFYVEGGIGIHLFSETYNNDVKSNGVSRRLSTAFQFGDHLGLGYVFNNELDIGLRVQHFSNGGIKKPNDGLNMAVMRVSYRF